MPSNNILKNLVIVPIITRHNEQTSPIRSNPHAPSLQCHSHCGRQFIVDCCVLSLNGSHLRPRPHPSLLDEPSLQPGCCCGCCCFLARLLLLLLLLLPRPTVAAATAAAASSPHCCCCFCLLARLLLLLLLLLPRLTVAATTAAAASSPSPDSCGCCCCSQYRAHYIVFGKLVTQRSFSSTVRSGKVGVRH
jgi:hypothetical protein